MKLIVHPLYWVLIVVALGMALKPVIVYGEPLAAAEQGSVRIVLHSEPCAIKAVANLPKRATFHEGGKTYEGCVGLFREMGMFLFYFEDKTVFAVPEPFFNRVHGS